MADAFSISNCNQYIMINANEPLSVLDMKIFITKIDAISKELGISKVLVDRRDRVTPPSAEDMLEIGSFLSQWLQDRVKIAVLVKFEPQIHGFFEAIADVKGIVVSFFEHEAEALKWLGVQKP